MEKIKVIIAEDSDFVRDGMRIILDVSGYFPLLRSDNLFQARVVMVSVALGTCLCAGYGRSIHAVDDNGFNGNDLFPA